MPTLGDILSGKLLRPLRLHRERHLIAMKKHYAMNFSIFQYMSRFSV
jgi:hypothetical protein